MALLGAWGLYLREQGIRFSVVGKDDARCYLSRMDVFQTLDIRFTETFERHIAAGRFVPSSARGRLVQARGRRGMRPHPPSTGRRLRRSDCPSYHEAGAKKR